MRIIIDATDSDEASIAMKQAKRLFEAGFMGYSTHLGVVTFNADDQPTHDTSVTKTKTGFSIRTRRLG